jgi:hypothetical protein
MKLRAPGTMLDAKKVTALQTSLTRKSFDNRLAQLKKTESGTITESGSGKTTMTFKLKRPTNRGSAMKGKSEEMRKLRALRKINNRQLPTLACSNCSMSAQCPKFRAGYECAFLVFMNSHEVEDESDLVFYMKQMIGAGVKRAQKLLIFEELGGGSPSVETSETLAHLFGQMKQLHEVISAHEEASFQVETSDKSIVEQVFGSLDGLIGRTRKAQRNPIEIPLATELNPASSDSNTESKDDLVRELMSFKDVTPVSTKPTEAEQTEEIVAVSLKPKPEVIDIP